MKKIVLVMGCVMGFDVMAQGLPGMDAQQMQALMMQAQQMQQCMQNIDKAVLEQFEQKAQSAADKIKSLCAAGDRDAALSEGMVFAKEVRTNPSLQQLQQCAEPMQAMLPQLTQMAKTYADENPSSHPCDDMQ
jgi:hypothetical protein